MQKNPAVRSDSLLCSPPHLYYHLVLSSPKQEARVRTKGRRLHHLACHSRSLFIDPGPRQRTNSQTDEGVGSAVFFFSSAAHCFVVTHKSSFLRLSRALKEAPQSYLCDPKISLRAKLGGLAADLFGEEGAAQAHGRKKKAHPSSQSSNSYLFFPPCPDRSCFHCRGVKCVWRFKCVVWFDRAKAGSWGFTLLACDQ